MKSQIALSKVEQTTNSKKQRVLVSCLSNLEHDPRVIREIQWLYEAGYVVESLGEGNLPTPIVEKHYKIEEDRPSWTKPKLVYGLLLLFMPNFVRFKLFYESRIPQEVTERFLAGDFDLVVLNDLDLLPWAVKKKSSRVKSKKQFVHLDLHEYHTLDLPSDAHWKILMNGFWRWLRTFISSPGITSRSVVAPLIGELYEKEFGVPPMTTVRNAPPFEELSPSIVDEENIELIYHGLGMWERGLKSLIESMVFVEPRFTLRLMLTGSNDSVLKELFQMVDSLNLNSRIQFQDPVPMSDVARTINSADIEVIFYEPITPNLRYSLPNKFFEAIQGRLAFVIGESPSMLEIVKPAEIGRVVEGWAPTDLAKCINSIKADELIEMKANTWKVAEQLSMQEESKNFLWSLDFGDNK
jgi:glycosyltransferase involved in cell wall biosynthesis